MRETAAEVPATMVVSKGCAWFGPPMEARVQVVVKGNNRQDTYTCPTCSVECDEIDMATFQRSLDEDPRPDFRQARGWSIGRHFPSVDEMYELYVAARKDTESPVPASPATPEPVTPATPADSDVPPAAE